MTRNQIGTEISGVVTASMSEMVNALYTNSTAPTPSAILNAIAALDDRFLET